jgi:hypothetical protein
VEQECKSHWMSYMSLYTSSICLNYRLSADLAATVVPLVTFQIQLVPHQTLDRSGQPREHCQLPGNSHDPFSCNSLSNVCTCTEHALSFVLVLTRGAAAMQQLVMQI